MKVFLGPFWTSIKEVKAPFMFDREHGIALHAMQGNQASPLAKGEVSWFFSRCSRNLGYILELRWGWSFKLMYVQRGQDSCLVARDTSQFSSRLGRVIWMPLKQRREAQCPFPVATGILGFLSIFKRSQGSAPFEVLNSASLLSCQRDMRLLSRGCRDLGLSLWSPLGIQTSLHLVR